LLKTQAHINTNKNSLLVSLGIKYFQGQNRTQTYLFPVSLDHAVGSENEVRLIDLFVDSLNLGEFGLTMEHYENGRPAYHPADLLKLYIYGYFNRVRSTRSIEKECNRNIEVIWLLKNLKPDHNTISNFKRDNPRAIKKVFHETVIIARHFNLIDGMLIAGDLNTLKEYLKSVILFIFEKTRLLKSFLSKLNVLIHQIKNRLDSIHKLKTAIFNPKINRTNQFLDKLPL